MSLLRAREARVAPLDVKANIDAASGDASGRFDALKETALSYAFVLACAGTA